MGARQSAGKTRNVNFNADNDLVGSLIISEEVAQRLGYGSKEVPSVEEQLQQVKGSDRVVIEEKSLTQSTEMEGLQQKESQIDETDRYWRNRLAQVRRLSKESNASMEYEFGETLTNINSYFKSDRCRPCEELKIELTACYRANTGETLRCSDQVAAFINCVSLNRAQILDAANS